MRRSSSIPFAVALFILVALALTPFALATPASAAPAGWTRIATGGLGNPQNGAMFPFIEFQGKAYSFVPNTSGGGGPSIPAPVWAYDGQRFAKAAADGFGDVNNSSLSPGAIFQGQLYMGTSNYNGGGQLWRTPDGTHWERVGQAVLSNPNNTNYWPLGVQDGKLVVASDNYQAGVQAWTYDGSNFVRANTDGFGEDAVALSMGATLNGRVNVIIQRYSQGTGLQEPLIPLAYAGGTTWEATGEKGFGDTANTASYVLERDGQFLYAGTFNDNGGQVWRFDGTDWTEIDIGPLSTPQNNLMLAFAYQGNVFVGTSFQPHDGPPTGPGKLYRQKTDGSFDAITTDGFGDPNNVIAFVGTVFKGMYLAGTFNMNGFQVWSSPAGAAISAITPSSGALGSTVTITGNEFGSPGDTAAGGSAPGYVSFNGAKVLAVDAISWTNTKIVLDVPDGATAGPVTVTTSSGASNSVTFQPTLSKSFYFAEGSTRSNAVDGVFDEYLCMMNPGDSAATVGVTYMMTDGNQRSETYGVAARSRMTVDVRADVGSGQDVSIMAKSDKPIVAERSMYFDYHGKWAGGDAVVGATAPNSRWYFAEGTTRDNPRDGSFDEYICLMNPGDTQATATINYVVGGGEGTAPVATPGTVTIPSHSRVTRDVAQDVGREKDVSAVVTSDVPIVAERPIYFDYHGSVSGGDTSIGALDPAQDFEFAEGCTYPWANEWLSIANLGAVNANVTLTYHIAGGSEATQSIVVGALDRQTVNVAEAVGFNKDVSVSVHSDQPLIAERSLYFDYGSGSWPGGTFGTGAQAPRKTFYFAEGSTRANPVDGTFGEWVTIENANNKTVNVKMSYLKNDGVTIVQTVQVQPLTRSTISVNQVLGPDMDTSMVIEASEPVNVERPMYFDYRGFAEGGSVTRGYGL